MREFVKELLSKKLPEKYYYHCVGHTFYVADKVVEIGEKENCTKEEIRLLIAAALWHDSGYISSYHGHEEKGVELARKYLPEFGFKEEEIEKIGHMIMATKIPQSPKNKLEEIICDADLEYLGTDKAETISNDLFKELCTMDPSLTKEKWNEIQIAFLRKHHYFTKFCKENKEPSKLAYLNNLIMKVSQRAPSTKYISISPLFFAFI